MFRPADTPMERGWVGRVEGDEVVHLASQTLQHLFTGGGSARDHARYRLSDVELLLPLPSPPSVRVFDAGESFEFANPAAVVGPGTGVVPPAGTSPVADLTLAGLVGPDEVVALSPVARVRAPSLAPPKDRDFAIVLGPWFTTVDEASDEPALTVAVDGTSVGGSIPRFDWEAARALAGENTRLRVGDLLVAPPAIVVETPPGAEVAVDVAGHGRLTFAIGDLELRP
jgi:hypothetical protein